MNEQCLVAISADGVYIHYDVYGKGAISLVFVHGWGCDRHYWDQQVEHFAPYYTVISLNLAGHGDSGRNRTHWTMQAFGQDVIAVVEQLGLRRVVLIGHSLGGAVIVEAAQLLPTVVIGLVGVDTWQHINQPRTPAQVAESLVPYRINFTEATCTNVRRMFKPTSNPKLVENVAAAMSATPPDIGIESLERFRGHDQILQEGMQKVKIPKITINSSIQPTDIDAQRYGVEVLRMAGVGHFVMLEDSKTFNHLLEIAVKKCIQALKKNPRQL